MIAYAAEMLRASAFQKQRLLTQQRFFVPQHFKKKDCLRSRDSTYLISYHRLVMLRNEASLTEYASAEWAYANNCFRMMIAYAAEMLRTSAFQKQRLLTQQRFYVPHFLSSPCHAEERSISARIG